MPNLFIKQKPRKFKSLLKLTIIFAIGFSLSACVSLLTPNVKTQVQALKQGQYQLDKSHASLLFKIDHFKLSKYAGRFNDFDASLDFDPQKPELTKLEAIIDIASLDINNEKLETDLLSPKWFNAERFSQARFTTESLTVINQNQFELLGSLQWREIIKPMKLMIDFNGGANNLLTGKYTVGFSARGSFLRSDYGVKTYLPIVGDQVEIEIYAEFQKQ